MTATIGGWTIILLLAAYLLHILWRQIAARSPVAIAAFVAGYFLLATTIRLTEPYHLLRPIWLPFVYSYIWLAISAAIWLPAAVSAGRRGLSFPAESPRITALLISQLTLGLGCLLTSPFLQWRPMAAYIMMPPMIVIISYLLYRLFLLALLRSKWAGLSWGMLLLSTLLSPLACSVLGGWLAPYLLGWT
ncbi:hypothetical protein DLM_1812 [Aquitalea magnusonii]|uniref:Uncharacterized protein n=1 Tax=Aquitalea magnusonii TaxID=332411 RepID=A0A3G9GC43_9NEIS|nr:hypothetical protein [Aquitalea magnusonii]BBF85428.1 hypothetical protein DLM_1812 [Aquitalea magnusonii]